MITAETTASGYVQEGLEGLRRMRQGLRKRIEKEVALYRLDKAAGKDVSLNIDSESLASALNPFFKGLNEDFTAMKGKDFVADRAKGLEKMRAQVVAEVPQYIQEALQSVPLPEDLMVLTSGEVIDGLTEKGFLEEVLNFIGPIKTNVETGEKTFKFQYLDSERKRISMENIVSAIKHLIQDYESTGVEIRVQTMRAVVQLVEEMSKALLGNRAESGPQVVGTKEEQTDQPRKSTETDILAEKNNLSQAFDVFLKAWVEANKERTQSMSDEAVRKQFTDDLRQIVDPEEATKFILKNIR